MASDWIPIVTTLPRDRDVFALMRELHCKRHAALGLLVDWLCWLDSNSTEGETYMLDDDISEALGWPGAAEALSAIGWVSHDERGYVVAVDFAKYNGESAKKRVEAMSRKRLQRSRDCEDECHNNFVTQVTESCDQRREEKRRDDIEGRGGGEIDRGGYGRGPAAASPPPTSDDELVLRSAEFAAWRDALRQAIPPLARLEALPQDSRAAAAAAFRAAPWASEPGIVQALQRYYAARRDTLARFGVRDYRPRGVRSIFQGLHDIAAYAGEFCERQDPELKKLEAARRRKAEQLEAERQRENEPEAGEEDWKEFEEVKP